MLSDADLRGRNAYFKRGINLEVHRTLFVLAPEGRDVHSLARPFDSSAPWERNVGFRQRTSARVSLLASEILLLTLAAINMSLLWSEAETKNPKSAIRIQ